MGEELVGKVSHYFANIGVAVVELSGELKVGDLIAIVGKTTGRVEQTIGSMQVNKAPVQAAKKGQSIGMKVSARVHEGDTVFKLSQA